MPGPSPRLVIDARPRGPSGPLAGARVLGRPILMHLLELADGLDAGPIVVHARLEEHRALCDLIGERPEGAVVLRTGPPPAGSAILRTDRLYDPNRLRRAVRRGRDPESAVIWRLDRPAGLEGAEAELIRRRSYQPLGRFWALAPARGLARLLRPTRVRPNGVTAASAGLFLSGSAVVAFAADGLAAGLIAAGALSGALVLDTADGHLARLQGTATEFGRWLDAVLDELGDMVLHAAIAWAAFVRDGWPGWLLLGMAYAAGKYVFVVGATCGHEASGPADARASDGPPTWARWIVRGLGHADVRWHLWIALAALGWLKLALLGYAVYYPLRALAGAIGRARRHG